MSEDSGSKSGDLSDSWEEEADLAEDNEETMEEEEELGLDGEEADEVSLLKQEQQMSVQELMRRYAPASCQLPAPSLGPATAASDHRLHGGNEESGADGSTTTGGLLSRFSQNSGEYYSFEEEQDDEDYMPPEPWKKQIRLGDEFQADIPTGLVENVDQPLRRNDLLMWRFAHDILTTDQVELYLRLFFESERNGNGGTEAGPNARKRSTASLQRIGDVNCSNSVTHPSPPSVLRDCEIALYILLSSDYDSSRALSERVKAKDSDEVVKRLAHVIEKWSEDECDRFEDGLRIHGKNFHLIQQEKLPERKVGELVQYYYVWKKTERHDMFVQRVRFEKRQFALNPNATDFMDHFMEQMNAASGCQSSSGGRTSMMSRNTPPPLTPLISNDLSSVTDHLPTASYNNIDHDDTQFTGQNTSMTLGKQTHSADNIVQGSTLISSDPKYAQGQWHATHFNEWTSDLSLPHLDSDTVADVLQ